MTELSRIFLVAHIKTMPDCANHIEPTRGT